MKLKWSQYCFLYDANDADIIVTHAMNKNVYKLSKNSIDKINGFIENEIADECVKHTITELYSNRFLVDKELKENEELKENIRRGHKLTKRGAVFFVPSFECNFRCTYCIVGDDVDQEICPKISSRDVIQAAKWICDQANKMGIEELSVVLFGGEPTLAHKENLLLMDTLNSIDKDFKLFYSIVTNGLLLTDKIMDDLISRGIQQVQITLDGPAEIHDKRRKGVDGSKTYDKILKNMLHIQKYDEIQITLRINIDRDNCPYIIELLRDLKNKGLEKKMVLNIAPVDPSEYSRVNGYSKEVLYMFKHIFRFAFENHFRVSEWNRSCGISARFNFSIAPDGNVYTCAKFIGEDNYKVASIYGDLEQNYYDLLDLPLEERCYKCKYVLMCFGGCRTVKRMFNTDKCIFYNMISIPHEGYITEKYAAERYPYMRINSLIK